MGEGERISRRRALELAASTAVSAGTLDALSGSADAKPPAASAAPQTVMLIRHAEKPAKSGSPFGVTATGIQDDKSLLVLGWKRAGALVELFAPAVGSIRPGLVEPTSLFAADPHHESQRPLETITPLSARLGFKIHAKIKPSDAKGIGTLLASTPGARLAAWQHQYIPSIATHLGTVNPSPPAKWPGNRFDIVWVFTRQSNGSWAFTQVPQLLLAGDSSSVIS
ncbi:MAG TPA: hypothetical protein VMU90_13930 [Solirubrobacteraceae bacterium]|nr:hypothetical protein [Solirubrobacteraceae bacterium]